MTYLSENSSSLDLIVMFVTTILIFLPSLAAALVMWRQASKILIMSTKLEAQNETIEDLEKAVIEIKKQIDIQKSEARIVSADLGETVLRASSVARKLELLIVSLSDLDNSSPEQKEQVSYQRPVIFKRSQV